MNEPETNMDATRDAAVNALQEEVQSLRAVVMGALFAVIILSGAVNIYLMRQARQASFDLAGVQHGIDEYRMVQAPAGADFWRKINEYARTHPDFKPIIDKVQPLHSRACAGSRR